MILGIIASSISASKLVNTNFDSIATVTVGSGGSAYAEFTSIPSTYSHIQIRGIARGADIYSYTNLYVRFNSDTGSNYADHRIQGDGASVAAASNTSATAILTTRTTDGAGASNTFGAFVYDVLDYASTSKYKTYRHIGGVDTNGAGQIWFSSGLWQSTSAISTVRIYSGNGNLAQYSHFALYGIKS